jgi:hypothetical protein
MDRQTYIATGKSGRRHCCPAVGGEIVHRPFAVALRDKTVTTAYDATFHMWRRKYSTYDISVIRKHDRLKGQFFLIVRMRKKADLAVLLVEGKCFHVQRANESGK